LVVDANILVRAVLGRRARAVIEAHGESVAFFVPEIVYAEAGEHVATLVIKHGGDPEKVISFVCSQRTLVVPAATMWVLDPEGRTRKVVVCRVSCV
jgi:predicted nucleic acid-binding protein